MEIPEEATQITMCYNLWHTIKLPEDLDRANVDGWYIKWGTLVIQMNDGTHIECDEELNLEAVNLKRGHRDVVWQDDDHNDIKEVPNA
tara:strand:- start:1623 stop:1886 length:264 start_codon:yes stop_codon:yes gene_type:complete